MTEVIRYRHGYITVSHRFSDLTTTETSRHLRAIDAHPLKDTLDTAKGYIMNTVKIYNWSKTQDRTCVTTQCLRLWFQTSICTYDAHAFRKDLSPVIY